MERKKTKRRLDRNFFNAMNYELAGEIGAIDPEEMMNNEKLITSRNTLKPSLIRGKKKK